MWRGFTNSVTNNLPQALSNVNPVLILIWCLPFQVGRQSFADNHPGALTFKLKPCPSVRNRLAREEVQKAPAPYISHVSEFLMNHPCFPILTMHGNAIWMLDHVTHSQSSQYKAAPRKSISGYATTYHWAIYVLFWSNWIRWRFSLGASCTLHKTACTDQTEGLDVTQVNREQKSG